LIHLEARLQVLWSASAQQHQTERRRESAT
jgi:hypothetical protein